MKPKIKPLRTGNLENVGFDGEVNENASTCDGAGWGAWLQ